MRVPRVRFTVRRMMGVVAVMALMLGVQSFLDDLAVGEARSGDEPDLRGRSIHVMVLLNVLVSMVVGLAVAIIGAALPDHDGETNDSDDL